MDQRTIRLRQAIKKQFDDKQEYVDVRPGNLGNEAYLVEVPGRPNYVYVREVNGGAVVQAFNARVASVWNLPVYIGFSNEMPDILQVIQQRSIPTTTGSGMAESPAVASHAETHIWPYGTDIIYPWKSQIRDGRVDGVASTSGSNLLVKVQRNRIFVSGSVIYAPEQVIDLFPYVPVTADTARWVTLSTGSSGAVEITQSATFAANEWALATIPLVPSNNAPNAAVRLYNGQTIIFQGIAGTDIQDLRWLEPGSGIAERYAPSNGPYVLTSVDSALPNAHVLSGSAPIFTDGAAAVGLNYSAPLAVTSGSLGVDTGTSATTVSATGSSAGTPGAALSAYDHVHYHGALTGGSLHALATAGSPGFVPALSGSANTFFSGSGTWLVPDHNQLQNLTVDDPHTQYARRLNPVALKTSAYSANANELIMCDVSSGSFAVTLPNAPIGGTLVEVGIATSGSSGAVKIVTSGSDVMTRAGGPTSFIISLADENVIFQYEATGKVWYTFPAAAARNFAVGFPGISEQTPISAADISIDTTTRVLTVTPPLGYFNFYVDGGGKIKQYTKVGAVSFPAFTDTSGFWYFHFDASGSAITTQTAWRTLDYPNIAMMARIIWNSTLSGSNKLQSFIVEYHLNDIPADVHQWFHLNGTVWAYGADLTSNKKATGDPASSGSNTVISLSSGSFLDGNLEYYVTSSTSGSLWNQDLGVTVSGSLNSTNSGIFPIKYQDGAGLINIIPGTRFPFPFNAATNIPEYLNTSGSRVEVANGRFLVVFLYALQEPRSGNSIKVITASTDFTTITLARAYTWTDIQNTYSVYNDNEIRPLYRLIFEVHSSPPQVYDAACKYAVLRETQDIRKAQVTTTTVSSGTIPATSVTFTPSGSIAATNVQSAIEELDTEKQNVLTNPIVGTGATGQVAYFSNGSTITSGSNVTITGGSSVFFKGPVGIGTTSPAYDLVVSGSGTAIASTMTTTSTEEGILRATSDSLSSYIDVRAEGTALAGTLWGLTRAGAVYVVGSPSANGMGVGTHTNLPLIIATNKIERMRFDTSGNVGIGTADQFGSGVKVVGIANATTPPSGAISGGGVLYSSAGELKWCNSAGAIATLSDSSTIRRVFSASVTDNTATTVFSITTANESGSTDGGGYSVFVHALITNGVSSGTGAGAVKSFTAQFCRIMAGAGTGVNSAVSEVVETASAATTSASRDIGTVTMTVSETSEYVNAVQFTVDGTGSLGVSLQVIVQVELIWYGFLSAPVLS